MCGRKKSGEKCAMTAGRDGCRVLVGTYRPENAAWIREKRLYNLPLGSDPMGQNLATTMQDFLLDVVPENSLPQTRHSVSRKAYLCVYYENGIRIERDVVAESDLKEYFSDCFHYHVGRFPSERQVSKYLQVGEAWSKAGGLCHEWFCSAVSPSAERGCRCA